MKNSLTIVLAATLASAVLFGCAGSPEQQIEDAYAALAAADSLEADQYVPELYMAAQDSFAAAHSEIEGQEGVAGVKPDYTRAKTLLEYVVATANEAAAQVPARKEEVRVETDSLIAQAQTRLAAVQEALAARPAGAAISPVNLQESSMSAQTALQQAVEAQASGSYAQAYELVRTALSEIESVETQLAAPATPGAPRS
ncbi:MAG TPA: DUF4398 domain-containing protein [Rhodothermales bacterium]